MQVSFYQTQLSYTKYNNYKNNFYNNRTNNNYITLKPSSNYTSSLISFGDFFDPNRTVPHIDYEEYISMRDLTKKRFRKVYSNFLKNSTINKNELYDQKNIDLPLRSEKTMDEFIKTSKNYSRYKDHPIICLGRSPKWFLNTALWMKDGIDDYKFVAFSRAWYRPLSNGRLKLVPEDMPTEKEELTYRKYLKRIKADPQSIIDNMKKTGQKTVITDYVDTGKGACSFLDILSRYAKDLGILEEFAKSIQIVCIGSLEYLEDRFPYEDRIEIPRVPMPELLKPFTTEIKQDFYNMDLMVFKEMLLNGNVNECRSTYYPHEAWTIYKPDQFRTGLVKDMKKVRAMVKELGSHKSMSSFTPAMYDYRNLLNFRILDALNHRNILKTIHKSKL